MIKESKIPKYTQKDVLEMLCISQSTLYRIRRDNGLLTKKVKRRYTEEEVEMLCDFIISQYE